MLFGLTSFAASQPGSCISRTRHPFAVSGTKPSPMIELWFNLPAPKQLVEISGTNCPLHLVGGSAGPGR
jgi:hypothetical protein